MTTNSTTIIAVDDAQELAFKVLYFLPYHPAGVTCRYLMDEVFGKRFHEGHALRFRVNRLKIVGAIRYIENKFGLIIERRYNTRHHTTEYFIRDKLSRAKTEKIITENRTRWVDQSWYDKLETISDG